MADPLAPSLVAQGDPGDMPGVNAGYPVVEPSDEGNDDSDSKAGPA